MSQHIAPTFQLAEKWISQPLENWYISEKMDGQRAIWCPVTKTLWSRLGNRIFAPDWWTRQMPNECVDGELWAGVAREAILSCTRRTVNVNDEAWNDIVFYAFDLPRDQMVFAGRVRKLANLPTTHNFKIATQTRLSANWKAEMQAMLDVVMSRGGEGLMAKSPSNSYKAGRTSQLLKIKPLDDSEAVVIGATSAREGKTGKILGLLGNLLVKEVGTGYEFEISGFTDAERAVHNGDWCYHNPGVVGALPVLFPKGTMVTFKFHGRNVSGIPNAARYFRKREDMA